MSSPVVQREAVRNILRIQAGVLALTSAALGGFGLAIMTAWLVIKGGTTVGPHLQLLSQFFYGYQVTWAGCFVGFFWGALSGAVVGALVGIVYNRVVAWRYL